MGKEISPRIEFKPDMLFHGEKDVFLSNTTNKQCIINVISAELKKAWIYIFHSLDDADVDIVKLAVQSSLYLLVLLLYHVNVDSKPLYYCKSS